MSWLSTHACPRYSLWNGTTYRPTNEGCLMREVVYPEFCKVCMEGLWLQLLKRIDLIDKITTTCHGTSNKVAVELATLELAQFRSGSSPAHEAFEIHWLRNGVAVPIGTNQTKIEVKMEEAVGLWRVEMRLHSSEVRSDPLGYLTTSKAFSITAPCNIL